MQRFCYFFIFVAFFSCSSQKNTQVVAPNPDNYVDAYIVQINDVYEIAALEGGKRGGLARVATVLNELRAKNPNTYFVIAGDFLNPSLLGTMSFEGKSIKGRQMVDVLNAMKLNIATLGNHEFDLDYPDLQARINESKFDWLSTDVFFNKENNVIPFYKTVNGDNKNFSNFLKLYIPNGSDTPFTIGIFSATINSVKKDFIHYKNYEEEARKILREALSETDVNIGITHLEMKSDTALLRKLGNIPLFIGGHDHDNMKIKAGNGYVTKADANAKSIYIHHFMMEKRTKNVTIDSKLMLIDEKIKEDSTIAFLVSKWNAIGAESMRKQGFNPDKPVANIKETLNGKESSIRNEQNNLGLMITKAMLFSSKNAKIALFNGGSVRIDDYVTGSIYETDVIRVMPFGGAIVDVELKGDLLIQLLKAGEANKGRGGYLQRSQNVSLENNVWKIDNQEIINEKIYNVIVPKFLLDGKERNIEFFTKENVGIIKTNFPDANNINDTRNDIRKAFIAYLRSLK